MSAVDTIINCIIETMMKRETTVNMHPSITVNVNNYAVEVVLLIKDLFCNCVNIMVTCISYDITLHITIILYFTKVAVWNNNLNYFCFKLNLIAQNCFFNLTSFIYLLVATC